MAVILWSAVSMKENLTRVVISCLVTVFFLFLFFFFFPSGMFLTLLLACGNEYFDPCEL